MRGGPTLRSRASPGSLRPATLSRMRERVLGPTIGTSGSAGEQRVDAGGGRLADHPLMQHRAQVAQRPEHLGAGHQHDQQRLDRHQPVRHPPHPERQRRRRADRDAAIGDAAGHHAGRQHAHRRVGQQPRPLGEPPAVGGALAERLQGRQALHGVEEFRAEPLHRLLARHGRCAARSRGTTAGAISVTSAATSITARPARPTTR